MSESAPNPGDAAERQRDLLLRIVRVGFVALVLTITLLNIIRVGESDDPGEFSFGLATQWWIPLIAAAGLAGVFLAIDLLTPNKKIQTIGGVIFGIVAGMIVTLALSFVVDLVATTWDFAESPVVAAIKVVLGVSLVYLGVTTVLQTQDDFRLVIPYVEFAKQIRGPRPLLLDSSALIDARVADVGETGLVQAPILVPQFVVAELQLLADSGDALKRGRGRRGLDVLLRMQRSPKLDVTVDAARAAAKSVDQALVELAQQIPAMIVTGDVALARIAEVRGVPVLNINDLANALKPALTPGQHLTIRLIKPGEQPGQAVGYLDDGTMVVAEGAADRVGREVDLTVRSTLQTSAGRMIFARPVENGLDADETHATETHETTAPPAQDPVSAQTPDAQQHPGEAATEPGPGVDPASLASRATGQPKRTDGGPFPPKPPARRTTSPRNPRR